MQPAIETRTGDARKIIAADRRLFHPLKHTTKRRLGSFELWKPARIVRMIVFFSRERGLEVF
jgi:hypothetical protein